MSGGGAMRIGDLVELQGDLRQQAMEIERRAFSHPWSLADFDCVVADGRAINLALWCGAELGGYAMAFAEGAVLHVVSLAVDEPYRRRGWGSLLVEELLRRGAARSCRICRLEVRRSNRAAQGLYGRCGFAAAGVEPGYYTRPAEDALVLERFIEPAADAGGRLAGCPAASARRTSR
ncbi:MAG: ribosomal protein S18-alanine N-acetyltransferase [Gemmatimonadota bacterium]